MEVLKYFSERMSQRNICEKYNIGKGTVGRIANARDKIEQEAENVSNLSLERAKRSTKFDEVNSCLLAFFRK